VGVRLTFIRDCIAQVSQAHVTSVLCELSRKMLAVSRYKRPLRLCMRDKILISANAKYHFTFTLIFFYKMNKGDLPLMYSHYFCCEFIDLVVFFGCYCVTPVPEESDRGRTTTAKITDYID